MKDFKQFAKPKKKKPTQKPEEVSSGIVYSHPNLKTIYYTQHQYPETIDPNLPERETLPDSPFSIYKDDQKNDLLNAYYQKMVEWGIPTVLEQEYAFREAEIRLLNDTPLHPISLSKNTPGFIYHNSYLNIFPDIVKNAWTPQLKKGYKLAILRKLPWMIHKDKFQVLQKPDSPQLSLL